MTRNTSHTGAIGELFAAQWFLSYNLEVFLNIPATGPADLAVWNKHTGKVILVDVKSKSKPYVKADGSYCIGQKCTLREDGVYQCVHIHGEAFLRVPEGLWEALGIEDTDE